MTDSSQKFAGILQPLVDKLEHNPKQIGRLSGQDIVMHNRKDIRAIIAVDENEDIHLLITPPSGGDRRLEKLDFKGLKFNDREWIISGLPRELYLDISCSTGTLPSFKRPFLRFAEDVLFDIDLPELQIFPADAVYKTALRWRKFWSPEIYAVITTEWIHGIFGELLFLSDLIERKGLTVIDSWTGPLKKDHDFQKGTDIAAEIKTSIDMPFRINCNIRQLDSDIFKKLYIVCYRLTTSETGTTLSELVNRVIQLIGNNETQLEKFYDRLAAVGYNIQLESSYNSFRLSYSQAAVFHVDEDFPKIVEKSFISPPDNRVSGIRYVLELTGIKELTIDDVAGDFENFKS